MAVITWKNAISDLFSNAADWSSNTVPGAGDDAELTADGGAAYTVTAQSQTVNSLTTASNAVLAIAAGQSFTMNNGTGAGANAGQVTVGNNSVLLVGGTFNNTSTVGGGGVVLNGVANFTELRLLSASTTFTGGGSVVLGTGGNNLVFGNAGAADTLVNVNNTFSGVGNIGDGSMTMNNETAGVVNANQTGQLVLNVNGGVTNTGLLEATNTGGLLILNTGVDNTQNSDAGKITATGSGAHVDLQNSTISGGTLTSGAGAQIDVVAGQTASLSGATAQANITSGTNLNVNNNGTLYIYGTINNAGTINLLAAGNVTELRIGSPVTTLTGGGGVVLGAGATNYIFAASGANDTLVNVNNTISGAGQLGNGSLTFVNQAAGVVNANSAGQLTLDVNGGVTNTGLLEATSTGGLFILNTGVDNTGTGNTGKITATGSGAHVDLQNTTISGGTLTAGTGAQIDVVAGQSAYLDGSQPGAPLNIATGTNVNVNNNAALFLYGTINNAGTINLLPAGNATELRLGSAVTALTGGGNVVMGGGATSYIFGASGVFDELDNVNNTISGAGQLGNADMTLRNEAAGVVNANSTGALTLDANGGVVNLGLLEATNTGGLFILNTGVDNSQNSNAGKITASGAGAHVDLQNTTISGGTLTTTGTGAMIDVVGGQSAFFDGSIGGAPVNIALGSTVTVNNNSALYLRGVINNAGVINLSASLNATEIRLNTPVVTLQGGGAVDMSVSANNLFLANDGYQETLNNVDNTIQGSGNLGDGDMTLIVGKLAKVNANQQISNTQSSQLVVDANGGVTNNGLMEATVGAGNGMGGTLFILNTYVDGTGGGKIQATGTKTVAATVLLQNSVIHGGVLITSGGPVAGPSSIQVVSGQVATLDGTAKAVTLNGVLNVVNNSTLYIDGAISDSKGSINLQSAANITDLRVNSATATLSGGGAVHLGAVGNSRILANLGYQTLTNVDNTIDGAGNIGAGSSLQLVNQTKGIINANQTTALTIQEGPSVQNTGLIESTSAGGLLVLNSVIDNTVANGVGVLDTGLMKATGAGHVDLQNSNIYGGTLTTTGSAFFDVVTGQSAGLYGTQSGQQLTLASGSQFNVTNNSTLYLGGTINNAGTITLNGAANLANLVMNSSLVTLTGAGHVTLAGGTNNDRIYQAAAHTELDNVNNIISGGGQFGVGNTLFFNNESAGVVNATASGGISINFGGVQMVNAGTLEATGGPLSVANSVFNSGSIIANGGNVTIAGNVNGVGSMTLDGTSTVEIGSSTGGGSGQTITFSGASADTFKLDSAQGFTGTVVGLATGKTIDLANVTFSTASLTYSGTTTSGVLTVTDGTIQTSIKLTGNYTQANFNLANDGSGHTNVTYNGTGMGSIPAPAAMAAAMAALGAGSSASVLAASATLAARPSLLALPHGF